MTFLQQRELKQKLKEEQWVESVARTHAAKVAELKQTAELLEAQIESARVYEKDLIEAKSQLENETKSRRVVMMKLQELQDKFEKLLQEKHDAGGWGGGNTMPHPGHNIHGSLGSVTSFGLTSQRRPTMAAEGVKRSKVREFEGPLRNNARFE
jgi:hypothetical protein